MLLSFMMIFSSHLNEVKLLDVWINFKTDDIWKLISSDELNIKRTSLSLNVSEGNSCFLAARPRSHSVTSVCHVFTV